MDTDGKNQRQLTIDPQDQRRKLALISFDNGQPIKFFALEHLPKFNQLRWLPDGQSISFISNINGVGNIWKQPINEGKAYPITNYHDDLIYRFGWSIDGKQLAIERGMTERHYSYSKCKVRAS